jgi:hypothetical protein
VMTSFQKKASHRETEGSDMQHKIEYEAQLSDRPLFTCFPSVLFLHVPLFWVTVITCQQPRKRKKAASQGNSLSSSRESRSIRYVWWVQVARRTTDQARATSSQG